MLKWFYISDLSLKKGDEMSKKACNNVKCIKSSECARHEAWLNGDKNYTTFKGTKKKGCGKFIQKK